MMENILMILSMIAVGAFTVFLNQKVKNKSKVSLILATIFVLYILTFLIIGHFKGN